MALASKLQIKPGTGLAILGLPAGVGLDAELLEADTAPANAHAVLVFVERASELSSARGDDFVAAALRDAVAWIAYPKAGQLGTDLNRDSLAALLSPRGIQPVRQVAIDDVWSALRFRPGQG